MKRSQSLWPLAALSALILLAAALIGLRLPDRLPAAAPPPGAFTPTPAPSPTSAFFPSPAVSVPTSTSAESGPIASTAAAQDAGLPTATATAAPSAAVAPTPGPTVAADLALEFTRVRPNEYLGTIARRYGVAVEDIVAFSRIQNPDMVAVGQWLVIPHRTSRTTPGEIVLPDSELVYGPAYVGFDLHRFVEEQGGYLARFSSAAPDGSRWTGADWVERVALRYSVGPRVLLALMEARSGWVTNPAPEGAALDYPLGHTRGAAGLGPQLEWAADRLNRGFYGWLDRGETAIRFADGVVARGAPGLNPGTVALQGALAADIPFDRLAEEQAAFLAAYRRLFGEPMDHDAGPVLPAGLEQPPLRLPWAPGEWWHLTGGPHGGWGTGSGWAALDFVPENAAIGGCWVAERWARAAAAGVVARSDGGEVLLDLDGDGDVRTGWVLQYLHVSDRAPEGARLEVGDPVGRPSCEGGAAETTHLHFARRYNGLWVDAGRAVPLVLDGWTAFGGFEYDGGLTKPGYPDRVASHSRQREVNGLLREP
ncbi:MAG: LysM peptidoglycan-binding domain-containing protein [Caldilineales bacterium]|nr:LysM peptidoglycan-binding domain-containing protein [Caldilineales bacterium]MDW8317270.1 LysM domain-containing protein [Anaerolineae bacterium]